MYQYKNFDQQLVEQRVTQFREQTDRYLAGKLDEEAYRPLRLQNGLYIQRHAPMLRVAIPYGTLSSTQLRKLASIARHYDRGFGHFTTRQNIQFNWIALQKIPDVLGELAQVQMHAIQTSGNCIRNITSDPLAGIVNDESIDARVICEIVRQWATLHPEFAFLPRKFKIAITATKEDRAAIEVHDIGLRIQRRNGKLVFDLWVGGGLGRTPYIGQLLYSDLAIAELLNYLDAILRVYNLEGRRDNKYKARIKILVRALGIDVFRERVLQSYTDMRDQNLIISAERIAELEQAFTIDLPTVQQQKTASQLPELKRWVDTNSFTGRVAGYLAVQISLKRPGIPPGDLSSTLMEAVADIADDYSRGEIRITHDQNIILPYVAISSVEDLYTKLTELGLAHPNRHLVTDAIACPGLDFCSLANAPIIELAEELHRLFPSIDEQLDIGHLEIKMSGCMNACGHHHIGHIGILGVDKKGEFWYQITLGGRDQAGAVIGMKIGPSIPLDQVGKTIRKIVDCYLDIRTNGELFVDTVNRLGVEPFKEKVYAVD